MVRRAMYFARITDLRELFVTGVSMHNPSAFTA
jgi:hypothetical protein